MDIDTPDVMAAVSARLREDESRTLAAKRAGDAVLRAVMMAEPDSLPPGVRLARERVEGLAQSEEGGCT